MNDRLYEALKFCLLALILGYLILVTRQLNEILDDRIMRVTEVKRDYHIRNFFGDIPTGADIKKEEDRP